mmetsp:Transcript_12253/g.31915  ORF Transcript_12253/g.31915 Transcript_12253/m.31915 type:complete len:226 (+) Transcript_12253:847-1524(+)
MRHSADAFAVACGRRDNAEAVAQQALAVARSEVEEGNAKRRQEEARRKRPVKDEEEARATAVQEAAAFGLIAARHEAALHAVRARVPHPDDVRSAVERHAGRAFKKLHPDRGGSQEAFDNCKMARDILREHADRCAYFVVCFAAMHPPKQGKLAVNLQVRLNSCSFNWLRQRDAQLLAAEVAHLAGSERKSLAPEAAAVDAAARKRGFRLHESSTRRLKRPPSVR